MLTVCAEPVIQGKQTEVACAGVKGMVPGWVGSGKCVAMLEELMPSQLHAACCIVSCMYLAKLQLLLFKVEIGASIVVWHCRHVLLSGHFGVAATPAAHIAAGGMG